MRIAAHEPSDHRMSPSDSPAPSYEDSRQSLREHVLARGEELRAVHGPNIGWAELVRVLADRRFVRYPTELVFDSGPLLPGEPAHVVARGTRPEDGFRLHIHPGYQRDLDSVPYLALYQLVVVNYGRFAGPEDAESFGAAALGVSPDDYYEVLCKMADRLATPSV